MGIVHAIVDIADAREDETLWAERKTCGRFRTHRPPPSLIANSNLVGRVPGCLANGRRGLTCTVMTAAVLHRLQGLIQGLLDLVQSRATTLPGPSLGDRPDGRLGCMGVAQPLAATRLRGELAIAAMSSHRQRLATGTATAVTLLEMRLS